MSAASLDERTVIGTGYQALFLTPGGGATLTGSYIITTIGCKKLIDLYITIGTAAMGNMTIGVPKPNNFVANTDGKGLCDYALGTGTFTPEANSLSFLFDPEVAVPIGTSVHLVMEYMFV